MENYEDKRLSKENGKKFGNWMTAREYLLSDLQKPKFKAEQPENELLAIREEMHAEIEEEKTHYGATPPFYTPGTLECAATQDNEDVEMTPPDLNKLPEQTGLAETLKFLEECPDAMLPPIPIERLETKQKDKLIAVKTNMRSYHRMKELYIQANLTKLKNHYYSGFFAILCCDNHVDQHVLDSFPCRVKKVFLIGADKCKYCKCKGLVATPKEIQSLMNLPKGNNTNIPKFYYIMSK